MLPVYAGLVCQTLHEQITGAGFTRKDIAQFDQYPATDGMSAPVQL